MLYVPLPVHVVDHVAAAQFPCPLPQTCPSCLFAIFSFPLSLTFCQMVPQFGASLPPTLAVAPQQMVGSLGCCVDTGKSAAEEDAALPAVLGVAECSLPDVPIQSDPGRCLDSQGLGKCEGEGYLEIPEGSKVHAQSSGDTLCCAPNKSKPRIHKHTPR